MAALVLALNMAATVFANLNIEIESPSKLCDSCENNPLSNR